VSKNGARWLTANCVSIPSEVSVRSRSPARRCSRVRRGGRSVPRIPRPGAAPGLPARRSAEHQLLPPSVVSTGCPYRLRLLVITTFAPIAAFRPQPACRDAGGAARDQNRLTVHAASTALQTSSRLPVSARHPAPRVHTVVATKGSVFREPCGPQPAHETSRTRCRSVQPGLARISTPTMPTAAPRR